MAAAQAVESHGDEWGWPDTYKEEYKHQFWTHSKNSLTAAEAWSLNHPNQRKKSRKLCDIMRHSIMILL